MKAPTQQSFRAELKRINAELGALPTPDQLDALRHDVLLLQYGVIAMTHTLRQLVDAIVRAGLAAPMVPSIESPFDEPPPEAA